MFRNEATYRPLAEEYADKYGVPAWVILATIGTESSFDPNAIRVEARIGDASRGLMQLLARTAAGLGFHGTPDQLFDPEINVNLGTKLLSQLAATHPGASWEKVYDYYNRGGAAGSSENTSGNPNVARWTHNAAYFQAWYEAERQASQIGPEAPPAPAQEEAPPVLPEQASTTEEGSGTGRSMIVAAAVAVLLWILFGRKPQ